MQILQTTDLPFTFYLDTENSTCKIMRCNKRTGEEFEPPLLTLHLPECYYKEQVYDLAESFVRMLLASKVIRPEQWNINSL